MNAKLPFLITVPHGGRQIPKELKGRIALSEKGIFDDSDSYTDEIYNLGHLVKMCLIFGIARPFVDAGRATSQLPPQNADGLIKSHTCYKEQVYHTGMEPDERLTQLLVDKYYKPFHAQISQAIQSDQPIFGFDCHSMAEFGTPVSPDPGNKRPIINLGNRFNLTCAENHMHTLATCFQEVFHLKAGEISLNKPFSGGFITQNYGNSPTPFIQIEINRKLYLNKMWFNPAKLEVAPKRIMELNIMMGRVLTMFHERFCY